MSRGLTIALVASILVLALGVAGLATYIFLRPAAVPETTVASKPAEQEEEDEKEGEIVFLSLKNFVTDLSDKDRLRYADITVSLAISDAAALEEAKKKEPQIRDAVLGLLRSRLAADLLGAAGKDRLAEELTKALHPVLKKSLKKVYITDMIVQ